ncbi:MAG TPA: D-2-hydroxyacid dehydrogenase [Xanthomonadales bacterium]|nr:D-2-hydroxyacid dehydrogenase [Xanthomonadales bacterium]
MTLKRGVFLDLGSVDTGDLDRRRLAATLEEWAWHDFTEPAQCAERISEAQVVVSNKCVLNRSVLSGAAQLKLVVVAATGVDHVDLDAAHEFGVTVCNSRDYATASVTQHVLTLMLNLLSGQSAYANRVRQGDWSRARQFCLLDLPIREASNLNLGIIGHGVLGRSVARAARALGMNVLVGERKGRTPRPDHLPISHVVAHADVLSLHCPRTDETRNLFDRAMMQRMKRTAILINTARGGIVNERDLASCLKDGIISGAGVDVLSTEPPPPDHPLLADDIPGLIVTPHNAWASGRARQALLDQVASTIRSFLRGQPVNRVG